MKKAGGRSLTAHITFLEMRERRRNHMPRPLKPMIALMRAQNLPVAYYRYLYDQVGAPYHWYLRKRMTDEELATVIGAATTQIHVLYADGCPAGYFELDSSGLPERVELAYFGLCQGYTGRGLGRWFLSVAIETAWELGPRRVTVNTNTLDHPAALPLYQKMGFEPIGSAVEQIPADV